MSVLARFAHYLIPQESNNQKAKILHHSSISSFIGFILISQLVLSAILIVKPAVLGFASQISPERVVQLTNEERAKVGAPSLRLNPLLSEAAQRKAGDMFAFNYWAHSSPSGRDPWSFFKEVGYRYLYAGENLARDFASPEAVVGAWMASSTHRENILNPKYQEIGISVVDGTLGGTETTLVVQHFGTTTTSQVAQVPAVATTPAPQPQAAKPTIPVSPEPTPTPTPFAPAAMVSQTPPSMPAQIVLAQAKGTEKPLMNPFSLTREISFVMIFLLLGVIVIDGVTAYRRKVLRLSGRSLAHFIFLGGMLLIVLLSSQGAIL